MKDLVAAFPKHLEEALQIAKSTTFSADTQRVANILICGMGGSGIGGKIVSQWLSADLPVPVNFCQDYTAPAYAGKNTLVIASSYSGNTEETLMCVDECVAKGAQVIAITSGGELESLSKQNSWSHVIVPGGNPPRAAIAYSLVQLVKIFTDLGYAPKSRVQEVEDSIQLIQSNIDEIKSLGKQMAETVSTRTPIFYSSASYEGIAVRAKQQFNENSKKLGWWQVIPEMNHNELVGWGGGNDSYAPIFLNPCDLNERNAKRWNISKERISRKSQHTFEVKAKGDNVIARSLYLIHVIDWASYLHAEMANVDAIEIEIIDYLKSELAKI